MKYFMVERGIHFKETDEETMNRWIAVNSEVKELHTEHHVSFEDKKFSVWILTQKKKLIACIEYELV